MPQEINKANFEQEVLKSEVPVLIDFWAPWCGPCKMIAPAIDEIEKEIGQKAKVCKINIDENPELATEYSIMSIPALMVVKNSAIMEVKVGAASKDELMSLLQKHL